MVGRTPWSATGVKIRPFGQSQAARRDVAQTLVSAAPRLISALFVHEQEARQECRAGRLKPAPRRVGDQFRPCNGLILTPMAPRGRPPHLGARVRKRKPSDGIQFALRGHTAPPRLRYTCGQIVSRPCRIPHRLPPLKPAASAFSRGLSPSRSSWNRSTPRF